MKKFLIFLLLFIMMFPSLFCNAAEENILWPKDLLEALGTCYDYCFPNTAEDGEAITYKFDDARWRGCSVRVYKRREYEASNGLVLTKAPCGG